MFVSLGVCASASKQSERQGRDCSRAVPEILCGNIQNHHCSVRSILYKSMGVIIEDMNKIKKDVPWSENCEV
jgi:hypothetical protein